MEEEFNKLKEYLDIYIQLLPQCYKFGGAILMYSQLPTFEDFKKDYKQMTNPHFKDSLRVYDNNKIGTTHTKGIGSKDELATRHYNYWIGAKYYTDGNISGKYSVSHVNFNERFK